MKLWGGRFKKNPCASLEDFTYSLSFDKRLALYDISVNAAWARALSRAGMLNKKETKKILSALESIKKDAVRGRSLFRGQEDIHTAIEERLVSLAGRAALKLRAGRSRNDQVATDVKLYLKDRTGHILGLLGIVERRLLSLAQVYSDAAMPGLTHMQPAQPVLLSHHLLAYCEMLSRDASRFEDCLARTDVLPLGSGALAGASSRIDRKFLARELGFSSVSSNSIDAVSDRDHVFEFMACASMCMIHLSRLAEEMILWASPVFGYLRIDDSFCTGSSLMPHKKNPDVLELIRGKAGRVVGHLCSVSVMLKGLPLAYNRDLQEDKEGLFDTVDTLSGSLGTLASLLEKVSFDRAKLAAGADRGFLNATECAEYLVEKGIPFREAHDTVGRMVLYCIKNDKELDDLALNEFLKFSPVFGRDIHSRLSVRSCIASKDGIGGTALSSVRKEIKKRKK